MNNKTKIRLIFVDDDPMLLAGTRRQLLGALPDCELAFFERAATALEAISVSPADIVFTDVRMPEMDGAEFLERVAHANPEAIRLAWTGQSDAAQLKRVFKIAHQVFGKPCPVERLHNMISMVVAFCIQRRESMNHAEPVNTQRQPTGLSILANQLESYSDIAILNQAIGERKHEASS